MLNGISKELEEYIRKLEKENVELKMKYERTRQNAEKHLREKLLYKRKYENLSDDEQCSTNTRLYYESKQKEFIIWMESEIKRYDSKIFTKTVSNILKDILDEYKRLMYNTNKQFTRAVITKEEWDEIYNSFSKYLE